MLSPLQFATLIPDEKLSDSPPLFTPNPADKDEEMLPSSGRSVSVIPSSCPVSEASSQSSEYLSLPSPSPPPPSEGEDEASEGGDADCKVYSLCDDPTDSLLEDELLEEFYRRTEGEKRVDEKEEDADDSLHSAFDHNISSAEVSESGSASPASIPMMEDTVHTPPTTSIKTPKSRSAGHVEKRREPVDAAWIRLDPLLTRRRPFRPKKRCPAPIGMTLGRKRTLFID